MQLVYPINIFDRLGPGYKHDEGITAAFIVTPDRGLRAASSGKDNVDSSIREDWSPLLPSASTRKYDRDWGHLADAAAGGSAPTHSLSKMTKVVIHSSSVAMCGT